MTQDILNFLTGGVFSTFKDLVINVIEWIITFFTNIIYSIFNPLINYLFAFLPELDMSKIDFSVLNSFLNMINYILDFLMIDKYVLAYACGSIIFRITYKVLSYPMKLVVAWWHNLAP